MTGAWPLVVLLLAVPPAPDAEVLTRLVREFLAGASRNDAAVHDRFWADDLVYTGSSGRRVGKVDILKDVRSAPPPRSGDPATTYTAEEVRVQQYGDTAVVAFRLVGTTERGGRSEVARFLNTGTFRRRDGRWQAVAWQATRLPRPDDEAKVQVLAAREALHAALGRGDAAALADLLDDAFTWTRSGERSTRRQVLDGLREASPAPPLPAPADPDVIVRGDVAFVRSANGNDCVLTLVHQGGAWKAVTLSTGAPR
jgi:ketosteroid isomerase-like protein